MSPLEMKVPLQDLCLFSAAILFVLFVIASTSDRRFSMSALSVDTLVTVSPTLFMSSFRLRMSESCCATVFMVPSKC